MIAKNWQLEQDVDDYMYQFLENISLPKKNEFVNDRTLYKKCLKWKTDDLSI